ncbi:MAG: hypothetical protein NVS1B10_03480 [Candidatus Saccharimonadales bacterium]
MEFQSETILNEAFENQFSHYLESLEPVQVEDIKVVIEELRTALGEIQQLPVESTKAEIINAELVLEELCIQLFNGLGIDYDETTIMKFMQNVTEQDLFLKSVNRSEAQSVEELNSSGTHEYKPLARTSMLGGLAQFIKQKVQTHFVLGRYALHILQPGL